MLIATVNLTTVNATLLIADIIQVVFPVMRCVVYFGSKTPLIDQVFMQIEMPIVRSPKLCIPTGYLIVEGDNFEKHRNYSFYNNKYLRLLVVNQQIDKDYNFNDRCAHYKSFDYVNGLHVYLLNVRMYNDDIIGVDFYAIRDCAKIMVEKLEERIKARTTRWRPAPELLIRVSAAHFMPFMKCTENYLIDGIETRIFELALPEAKYKLQCYGYGQWGQAERDVVEKKADIGFGGYWDIKSLQLDVDFSVPLFQTCATMLVPKPHLLPMASFSFQALNFDMWMAIICVIILVALIHKWQEKLSFITAFLEVYRTVVNSPSYEFTNAASRIVYVAWLMTCVLITTGFSAGFTLILNRPRLSALITTFKDVFDQQLRCYEQEAYIGSILNSSNDNYLRKIAERMVFTNNDTPPDLRCEFCDILPYKYVMPSAELDEYSKHHLMVLPDCYGEYKFVIDFKTGSPIKRLFDDIINQAREHGLMNAWLRRFMDLDVPLMSQIDMFTSKFSFDIQATEPRGIEQVQGAFYALCIGSFISFLVFTGEHIRNRFY